MDNPSSKLVNFYKSIGNVSEKGKISVVKVLKIYLDIDKTIVQIVK